MVIGLNDFRSMIGDFYNFMGRDKQPRMDRIKLWFDKLKKMSGDDVRESFEFMKDNLDSLPHNIPKAIKTAIFNINKGKPGEQDLPFKKHRYGYCEDCAGTGIFKLRVFDKICGWSEPIKFCSQCDNYKHWTNSPGDRMSRNELEGAGYRFKSYDKVLVASSGDGSTGTEKELKNIAVNLGESKRLNEGEHYQNRSTDEKTI